MTTCNDLPGRMVAKIRHSESGCWEWTAFVNQSGYGQFYWEDKRWYAHRLAYTLLVGPIGSGLTIDHLCRNTRCVNPAHMEPVTRRENLRRSDAPSQVSFRTDRCRRGHDLSGPSGYVRPDGKGRFCAACAADRKRAARRRASSAEVRRAV